MQEPARVDVYHLISISAVEMAEDTFLSFESGEVNHTQRQPRMCVLRMVKLGHAVSRSLHVFAEITHMYTQLREGAEASEQETN